MLSMVLGTADPDRFNEHELPFRLQTAVLDRLRAEERRERRAHRSRYVVASAAAAVRGGRGPDGDPGLALGPGDDDVALVGSPTVHATARLTAEPWGTAMDLRESGQPSGEVLSVFVRTVSGSWWQTGTYRTVGSSVRVTMACALKMSKIKSVWIRQSSGTRRPARLPGRARRTRPELTEAPAVARPGRRATSIPYAPAPCRRAATTPVAPRTVAELLPGPGTTTTGPACTSTTPPGPGARSWPRAAGAPRWRRRCAGPGPFHIGVLLDNVPEYLFWLGAAALAGATVVGINPTRRGDELARDIRFTDCQLLVTDEPGAAAPRRPRPRRRPTTASCAWTARTPTGSTRLARVGDRTGASRRRRRRRATRGARGPLAPALHLGDDRRPQGRALHPGPAGGHRRARRRRPTGSRPTTSATAPCRSSTATPSWPCGRRRWPWERRWRWQAASARRAFSPTSGTSAPPASPTWARRSPTCSPPPKRADDADNPLRQGFGTEASAPDRAVFERRFGCRLVEGYGSSEGGTVHQRHPRHPARLARPPRARPTTWS